MKYEKKKKVVKKTPTKTSPKKKATPKKIDSRWERFEMGERLTNSEIDLMIAESEAANNYCTLRGFKPAAWKISTDIASLYQMKYYREIL